MGIFSDFLNTTLVLDDDRPIVALDRVAHMELTQRAAKCDPDHSAIFAQRAEVQTVVAFVNEVTGGNYTLTFTLKSGEAFTTANIAHNANAATVETAIDIAATAAAVVGWTNGDISVSGGPLTTGNIVLTFDGDSVKNQKHPTVTIADVDLVADTVGAVTTTVNGAAGTDEEQEINTYVSTPTSGNYSLTFLLGTSETFTTGNIAYNDANAAVEAAIDAAATGNVTSWTNGDISVSGGDLTAAPLVFLFDGASVEEAEHTPIVINDVDLTFNTVNTVIETQAGGGGNDEIQTIGVYPSTIIGGNYALEFTLNDATNFTTGNIAFDADATSIEAAVDAAANGVVAGWTDGDITVTGGNLTTNPLTLTFDGLSVNNADHVLTVISDIDLEVDIFGAVTDSIPGVDSIDEEQEVAVFDGTVTSGNYTLAITLNGVAPFTTANIAYSANAATIETAIDVAATAAAVPGWTNGDISVSGGPLTTADVLLVFDGASVAGDNHAITVIADVDLVAENVDDPIVTINGQTNRTPWAILSALGLITSAPPVQGETPTGLALASNPNTNANWPRPSTIQAVAEQAAIDDDNIEVFNEIMSLFHIQPHTPR